MTNQPTSLPEPAADPWHDPALSLAVARRIDDVCQEFEQAWQTGANPAIEACLGEFTGLERTALLRELLVLEIEYRRRRGQVILRDDYSQRFPEDARSIELALHESLQATTAPSGDLSQLASSSVANGAAAVIPQPLVDHPRYRVLRLLGRGGMGAVYLAEHRLLNRLVALKVINPDLLARPGVAERFRREAEAAARLNHPNVVAAFDADTAGDVRFFVMEFVPGIDLARVVIERGPLPIGAACQYVRQAALGLQHAHERGMVHRDIGPRNLMLTDDGQIKILDFGLARVVSENQAAGDVTTPGSVLGSLDFIAPEQADDPRRADIRADIYSLGCTLFYLLAGRAPFPQGSAFQKLKAHAEQIPPSLAELRPDAPRELSEIVHRMLAKRPDERFQTPGAVAEALLPLIGGDTTPTRPISRQTPQSGDHQLSTTRHRPARSNRRMVTTVGALAFVLGSLAIFVAWPKFWSAHGRSPASVTPPDDGKVDYDEAIYLLGKRQERPARDAIQLLTALTARFPDFAGGHVALADAYNLCGDYGWDAGDTAFPQAKAAARAALRIDPELASAHLALAFALHAHDCNWSGAELEYQSALALDPDSSAAHHWFAWFLVEQGRLDEAKQQIDRALRLSPVDLIVVNNVGAIRYYCREYEEAIEKLRHAWKLDKHFHITHYNLGLALTELGRLEEALAEFDLATGISEGNHDLAAARAYAFARNGHSDEARRLLAPLELAANSRSMAHALAAVRAALGDRDAAFAWLQICIDEHASGRTSLKVDPRFKSIRTDERFQQLLKQIGLAN